MNVAIARIAAALAKSSAGQAFNADEISADALALGRLTRDAREAVLVQQPICNLAYEAQLIAERYGAELVAEGDPDVFIFGLRFRDGSFSGPMRNLFAVM